jgi:pimeloyl-ACP methyl ester carboxylesterase
VPFVEARGLRFHTQQLGRDGAPVVMLHGLFTGSLASWWFTAAPALGRSHLVRLLDLRGHGLSDCPPAGYDTATMVDDVLALTEDLGPFSVVGHSYGGLLGLRLALARPDRVTRLVCVEAPLVGIRDHGPDDEQDAPSADASDAERRLLTETSILADLRAEAPVTDDDLRALTVPTMFVFGSKSWCAPAAERVRAVLPDAPCHVLDGGHAIHLDARREVTELLVDFLSEPSSPPAAAHDPLHHEHVPYG